LRKFKAKIRLILRKFNPKKALFPGAKETCPPVTNLLFALSGSPFFAKSVSFHAYPFKLTYLLGSKESQKVSLGQG
jgi:hypothetical protein